jgi:hypothetical protein
MITDEAAAEALLRLWGELQALETRLAACEAAQTTTDTAISDLPALRTKLNKVNALVLP